MKITDTYGSIFSAYDNGKFNMKKWERYLSATIPAFAEEIKKDSVRIDFENRALPVLNSLPVNKEKAELAHTNFLRATNKIDMKIKEQFNVSLDVNIVFYLGLCNAAGWATEINNSRVLLLGIEKIVELDWYDEKSMLMLIYHELGHIWHFKYEKRELLPLTKRKLALRQLIREGIAMTFEQIMCGDENYFHQNTGSWIKWCNNNEQKIKKEYMRRIKNGESVQDFFGDWCFYDDHSDIGYFLGSRFIRYLMNSYQFEKIASFSLSKFYKLFIQYCEV